MQFVHSRVSRSQRTHPAALIILHCLHDLGPAGHDKGSFRDDRLIDRLAAEQQKRGTFIASFDLQGLAIAAEPRALMRLDGTAIDRGFAA